MNVAMVEMPAWEIERNIVVRGEEDTNPDYGKSPGERVLQEYIRYGILVLDKQAGPTSHEVTAWVKKLLKVERAGHSGTLDPKVTGVLPICLEESTKIVQALLYAGKKYICVMRTHKNVDKEEIVDVLKLFEGEIYQRPPVRASVKRRLRTRRIYDIEYLEGDGRNWLFEVACQSGTYIRKLCHDVGEVLGTGAHMQELRRNRSGPFLEEESKDLYDLSEALEYGDSDKLRELIDPMERGLELIPKIWIRDSAVEAICTGAKLAVPGILRLESKIKPGDLVGVMTLKGEAVALMNAEMGWEEILVSDHGIAASPERVLMPRGTYPKMW
ncbi:MAG: RNA-guided pseudouridylation complex pseudouridine synthase subunit Cbf5 [Candidatus Bathyarchaeia archaeon]